MVGSDDEEEEVELEDLVGVKRNDNNKWDSAGTLETWDETSNGEEDSSIQDESDENEDCRGSLASSKNKCYVPSNVSGIAKFMINTNDPSNGTIWVYSPFNAQPHLELNINRLAQGLAASVPRPASIKKRFLTT